MASTPSGLQLAVTLFERGFEEVRIEEALQCCSTLEEAIAWAAGDMRQGGATAGAPAAAPLAGKAALAAGPSGRRRVRRKVADGTVAAPMAPTTVTAAEGSLSSAPVGSPAGTAAPETRPSTAAGLPPVVVAVPSDCGDHTATAPKPANGPGRIVSASPIEPRDASEWWRLAAVRWQEITTSMKRQARSAARSTPETGAAGKSCAPRCEMEAERAQMPTDATPGVPLHKRQRLVEDTGEKAAVVAAMPRRPPATPCSAEPQRQQQQHAQFLDDSKAVRGLLCSPMRLPGKALTPRASPHAMRINSRTEACEICCNEISPWRAVRLGCGHGWYCEQCIQKHTEARLAVGAASITCPECSVPLAERDLRKLLPAELIERLLARSLEQAISSAADLWACPTPNCPMRVALGDGELPRLKCSLCKKDSCLRCFAQPYHKGLTCEEHAERMRDKGKRQQKDEDSLMKWIKETGTKQCPTCRMAVTKQNLDKQETQRSECHKMYCRNCATRFCFKCLAVLTDTYTCGCSIDAHGFVNPHTGRRLNHLRRGRVAAKGKPGQ